MKPFSISYYLGEKGPTLRQSEFDTVQQAGDYANSLGIGLSRLTITEWDTEQTDGYGVPGIIGSCNLDEAYESKYSTLNFY